MKKSIILNAVILFLIGCGGSAQQTANSNVSTQRSENPTVVSSHSSDLGKPDSMPQSQTDSNASSSGASPMSRTIDVSQMTAQIEKAEKSFRQNQKDEKAKDNLAEAYFVRAFALTEAAQYRSALGDFRKGLKFNPNNTEAKAMHDRIIEIFESIRREPPKEGEEPPPLPFNKG